MLCLIQDSTGLDADWELCYSLQSSSLPKVYFENLDRGGRGQSSYLEVPVKAKSVAIASTFSCAAYSCGLPLPVDNRNGDAYDEWKPTSS